MKFLKGSTKKSNKRKQFYIARYFAVVCIFLSFCLLSPVASAFPTFFASKYWLMADAILLFILGKFLQKKLMSAQNKDAAETNWEYGGDNASTLLFFSTPLLWLLNFAALAHIYYLWNLQTPLIINLALRMQIGGIAAGIVLFLFGQAAPFIPFQSKFGFSTKNTTADITVWKKAHAINARILTGCGVLLLIFNLFVLTGAACLYSTVAVAVAAFSICYAVAFYC
ncbi:MAG: hypothetical protein PHG02_04565 [Oscillospiraceae bacterium]|nr:hypothetical protein [Oscillospiraceae bacterium]